MIIAQMKDVKSAYVVDTDGSRLKISDRDEVNDLKNQNNNLQNTAANIKKNMWTLISLAPNKMAFMNDHGDGTIDLAITNTMGASDTFYLPNGYSYKYYQGYWTPYYSKNYVYLNNGTVKCDSSETMYFLRNIPIQ